MGKPGIIVSENTPGTSDNKGYIWLKLYPDGKREWFEKNNGSWALVETEFAPATADHTHSSFNLAHDGDKMEITKLTVVDGIITELEFNV